MKEIYVKDIVSGNTITGFFALRKCDLLEKDGRFRLAVELGDSTGRIDGILWDAEPEAARSYSTGTIVKVKGTVITYQGERQIRIDRIRTVTDEDQVDLGDFLRRAGLSKDQMSAQLDELCNRVENTYLKKLLKAVFGDADFRERYLTSPAGKLLHHDTIGGLAEHSLTMAQTVVRLADMYPRLDRDLLICGALLHDVGKIWEFETTATIEYTDAGRLVGHISQGDEFICGLADSIDQFPDELLVHLRHLIISHHGEKEKGSPVVPQTPEAVFLHHVDELDSGVGAVEKIRERTGGEGWSSYQKIFDRFFYFGSEEESAGKD